MAAEYTKIFTNPYPNGWENLPSVRTPIIAQALQQHTNTIINIEDFLSANSIPKKTSDLQNDSIIIPTKLSDFNNDSGFITSSDLPTKVSDLNNDSGFITESDIPTELSEFNNDLNFVNNAVNDLVNYFSKSETYSKQEIQNLIANIDQWDVRIVEELPASNISETTVYFIRKDSGNVKLASDYEWNLDSDQVRDEVQSGMIFGDPVINSVFMEDPYG